MHYAIPIGQSLRKFIKTLHHKQTRDERGLFVAEGEKLVEELLKSLFQAEFIVVRESASSSIINLANKFNERGVAVYTAPKHQFDQLCDTKTPQGILAVVNTREQKILPKESFIALDGVSDPGNLGTIIRAADWFGINQVIIGNAGVDGLNPKTVRSTMGSIFRINVIYTENLVEFLQKHFPKVKIFGADIASNNLIDTIKHPKQFGLVFGNETQGISSEVKEILCSTFKIPGYGQAESLNVSVSVGISLYHFTK